MQCMELDVRGGEFKCLMEQEEGNETHQQKGEAAEAPSGPGWRWGSRADLGQGTFGINDSQAISSLCL